MILRTPQSHRTCQQMIRTLQGTHELCGQPVLGIPDKSKPSVRHEFQIEGTNNTGFTWDWELKDPEEILCCYHKKKLHGSRCPIEIAREEYLEKNKPPTIGG